MRAIAVSVGAFALVSLWLIGADALVWQAPQNVRPAAFAGLLAAILGFMTAALLWRESGWAPHSLALWSIATAAFILLMPVLVLRRPAPEDQLGNSVAMAVVFALAAAGALGFVWRRQTTRSGKRGRGEVVRPAG